jgi:hypothetical protein
MVTRRSITSTLTVTMTGTMTTNTTRRWSAHTRTPTIMMLSSMIILTAPISTIGTNTIRLSLLDQ